MLIFLSGSINSGKTTTAQALAKRLNADCINVDDLTEQIPNFSVAADLDKVMDIAIDEINTCIAAGRDVVANYVVRQKDYERFASEIDTDEQYVITLAPRLEVAQSQRGDRKLTEWEIARIAHHYSRGVATPAFGHVIDNSDIGVDETVDKILRIVTGHAHT